MPKLKIFTVLREIKKVFDVCLNTEYQFRAARCSEQVDSLIVSNELEKSYST